MFALFLGLFSLNLFAQADKTAPKWDLTRPNPKNETEMNSMTRMQEGSEVWRDDVKTYFRYVNGVWIPEPVGGIYTAGTGLDLSGNEFSVVDAELNPSWDNVTGKPTNWIIKGVNTITSEFTVGESNGPSFSLNTIANEFRAYGGQDGVDQVRHTIAGGIASYNFESTGFGVNDYIFDLTYNSPNDVARKVDVDAAISAISSSGINVLANGQVSLTNLTGPHAVTTVTHGIGVPPLPQNINVTLYRSNQQTNTGVQVAIGNITSTTFDIITPTTGTDDLVASWVVYSGGGGGTPATEGHTIQDDGTPVAQQPNLNFTGPGVTVTNDGLNNRTTIDISSGGGTDDQNLSLGGARTSQITIENGNTISLDDTDFDADNILVADSADNFTGSDAEAIFAEIGAFIASYADNSLSETTQTIPAGVNRNINVPSDGSISVRVAGVPMVTFYGPNNRVQFNRDATVPNDVYDASWNGEQTIPTKDAIFDKIESISGGLTTDQANRLANSNNIVRTFYTTEDVTTTVANQEVQSGGDIGSKVINTISGATTATAELTNTSATKIDVYSFDVLDAGGQWDITCTNGFVADGFTGDTVRLDGIGSVDFVETGVNTGIFQVTPGANVSYVATASLIVPSLDNANTVAYIDAREFAASSNGASVSPTDQSGNGTTFTSNAITKQTDADSDPTFAVNGSSSRISLANNFNFQTGVAQSIGIFISADGMGTGARFSKRDDSSGGSNDHFAIYNGYYYMGGNEGNPSFSSDSNVLITLTKTTGDVWYIYEDGTQRATGAWTNETSTADLLIGAQVNGGGFNDYATGEFEVFFITNDFITNTEAGTIANEINTR